MDFYKCGRLLRFQKWIVEMLHGTAFGMYGLEFKAYNTTRITNKSSLAFLMGHVIEQLLTSVVS